MENSAKICVAWKNLHYQTNGKVILQNISGCLYSGTMNGLLAPSGSGKTTLIKVLHGSLNATKINDTKSSQMYFDENILQRSIYIGQHVAQETNVFQRLKVGEVLRYAYRFKNSGHIGDEKKAEEYIELVMSQLMLHSDLLQRRLSLCSGGETRRIFIAAELMALVKPSLVLLDEPSSALDSTSAFEVMQCLKNLTISQSTDPITVLVSIHMPNSAITELFDQLIVLSKGNCIFSGPPKALPKLLNERKLLEVQIPPIESLLKVASAASDDPLLVDLVRQATSSCEMFVSTALQNNPQLRSMEERWKHPQKWFTFTDLFYHLSRQFRLQFIANCYTLLWQLTLSSTTVLLLTSMFSREMVNPDGCTSLATTNVTCRAKLNNNSLLNENINYLHFLLMTVSFQMACTSPALFHPLFQSCKREIKNQWYSISVFYISTSAVTLLYLTITALIIATMGYFLSGQYTIDPISINWLRFFSFLIVIVLICLYSNCIGELVVCLLPDSLEVQTIISQLIICFCTILNDFFFMSEEIGSSTLMALSDLIAFKYLSRYLIYIFYGIDRCDDKLQMSLVLEKHYVNKSHVPMYIARVLLNVLIIKTFTWLLLYFQFEYQITFYSLKNKLSTPVNTKLQCSPSVSFSISGDNKRIYIIETNVSKSILAWRNLSLFASKPFLTLPNSTTKKPTILNNINCDFDLSNLYAILGASGSGKTSLLRVLNGQLKFQLSAESQCYISSSTPIRSCFIAQNVESHLLPGLTAIQSLLYASQLKNSHFSASDHMKSALMVLDELNLPDVADSNVNHLSGGERKRLAVGLELVAFEMPNFICLDELVSGLDSHSAATVISTLRKLADTRPVTIITVIHQPTTQMLYSFDQLFVMSKTGHCVFSGPPTSISEHLRLALQIDLSALKSATPIELLIEYSCKNSQDMFLTMLAEYQQRKTVPNEKLIENKLVLGEVLPNRIRFSPRSTFILFSRYLVYVLSYRWIEILAFNCIYIGYAVALQFFFDASIALPSGCLDMEADFNNTCSRTVQMVIDERLLENNFKYNIFTNNIFQFIVLIHTSITFGQEMTYFISEHQNGWYSSGSFYLSKSIFEILPMIPVIFLYVAIIDIYSNSSHHNGIYWHLVLLFSLSTIGFQGLAHIFGILLNGQTLLLMISSSGAFIFQVMLGNFFISLQRLHYAYRFMANGSMARFSFESLILLQYGFGRCTEKEIQPFLYLMQIDDDHYQKCLMMMIVNIVFTRIVAIWLITHRRRSSEGNARRKVSDFSLDSYEANWLKF